MLKETTVIYVERKTTIDSRITTRREEKFDYISHGSVKVVLASKRFQ